MQVKQLYTTKERCRAGGGTLKTVMDFGELCLSGFVAPAEPDPETAPLELCIAEDSGLLQLRHSVDPERMFRQYWYKSSRNEVMREHLREVAYWGLNIYRTISGKREGMSVLDIGCNDGTLLNSLLPPEVIYKAGYDPSNIELEDGGLFCRPWSINYVNDFFDSDHYLQHNAAAQLIFTVAMFYDIDDPVAFAQGIKYCLAPDGVWIIEMHYAPDLLRFGGFDAVCHEHLTYYSLTSLEYVLQQAQLRVLDVTSNAVNGGSFRVAVVHDNHPAKSSAGVAGMRAWERDNLPGLLTKFIERVHRNKEEMRYFLMGALLDARMVMGYGASTKGNTLLQWYGIDSLLVRAIAERNPDKVGLVTAGSRIPIISEEEMRKLKPDYLLMLPYHFRDAFMDREAAWMAKGGKWIIPVPELVIRGMEPI